MSAGSRALQGALLLHPDAGIMAQSRRDMVLHPAGSVAERRFLHHCQGFAGAHRCIHRRLQRKPRTVRMEKEEGLSASVQRPTYHPTLIPGLAAIAILNTFRASIRSSHILGKYREASLAHVDTGQTPRYVVSRIRRITSYQ